MKQILTIIALAIGLAATGCQSQKLAEPGPYKGDAFLFNADQTIVTSFKTFDVFVKWEYTNRVLLAEYPEVRRSADKIRVNYTIWRDSVFLLRDAYAANPTTAGRDKLTAQLAILNAVLLEAQSYITKIATPTT